MTTAADPGRAARVHLGHEASGVLEKKIHSLVALMTEDQSAPLSKAASNSYHATSQRVVALYGRPMTPVASSAASGSTDDSSGTIIGAAVPVTSHQFLVVPVHKNPIIFSSGTPRIWQSLEVEVNV